jgi:tetratricopeptide (TPR) repeat protein
MFRTLVVILFFCANPIRAAINVTPAELDLLPDICKHTQTTDFGNAIYGAPSAEAKAYIQKIGETFWAMHHYCWGLVKLARAEKLSTSAQQRVGLRESAADEFNYVIRHASRDSPVIPEMWFMKGRSLALLKRHGDAIICFDKALSVNPSYAAAHAEKLETLIRLGDSNALRNAVKNAQDSGASSPYLDSVVKAASTASKSAK